MLDAAQAVQQPRLSTIINQGHPARCRESTGERKEHGTLDTRPTIFIGSSSEAQGIVDAFHSHLEDVAEVFPWKYGVLKSGEFTLESLVKALNRFDFAALILTPDDLIESRGTTSNSPRDNVIFEIGLFIGRLGRERVFLISERNSDLKIPTDLLGVKCINYRAGTVSDGFDALLRSTRPAFRELETRMKEIGCLPSGSAKTSRYGMLEYSDTVRDRDAQYMDAIEGATNELYINGTALSNMVLNSWGAIIRKSRTARVNLLMLDPQLAENLMITDLMETTYRTDVLRSAQLSVDKISAQVRQLPDAQRANIKLYLTKYFMPISALVADPNSGYGRMVVEVIGASSPSAEYFSRPRYFLEEEPTGRSMFMGYWRQIELLFSADRATLYEFDRAAGA